MKALSSSFDGEMVEIYDLFFLDGEKCALNASFVMKTMAKENPKRRVLLDVGCGTGAYAEVFSTFFERVVGIDRSEDMISYAAAHHKRGNIDYLCMDAGCGEQYTIQKGDAAVALAHVIGYQLTNASLVSFLETIYRNLDDQGLFFFSFYYQPPLFLKGLAPKRMEKRNDNIEVVRLSNAQLIPDESCLGLDYYYILNRKGKTSTFEIHEKMRYFSKQELDFYLNQTGFEVISFFSYEDGRELSSNDWNAGCLARKCHRR